MHDLMQTVCGLGHRLADAGREARQASTVVAGDVLDQMTRALGAAAGEVVRAAVVGAVAVVLRGAERLTPTPTLRSTDRWDDFEGYAPGPDGEEPSSQGVPANSTDPPSPVRPRWVAGARTVGTALTVAAGAAAAVPGGRLVAAGLGAVAAVAGLAARAGAAPASE
jgi:hypothetical protein